MKVSAQNSIRYSLFSSNLYHWECRNHRSSVHWTLPWHSIALLHPLEGRGRHDGACILHCPSDSSNDRILSVSCPLFQWDDEQIWSSAHSSSNVQSLSRSSGWAADRAVRVHRYRTLQQYKRGCWEWRTCTKRHRISGQGRCTSVYVQDESESISLPPPLKALPFTKANSLCKETQSASFLLSYILCAAAVKQMFNIAF